MMKITLFFFSSLLAQSQPPEIDPHDKTSLLIFRVSIHDPNRTLSTWYGSNWTGLACLNPTGKVISLSLSGSNLSGQLHPSLCKLTSLQSLDLSRNHFFLSVSSLHFKALRLSHNLLTGDIPARIGNLTYLQVIDLSHNALTGSIPLNIVGCFQLLALIISNNNLSGEIQPELDALDSLKILDISNNKISGEIPLTLAGLKSLEIVDISSNNLSGNLNEAITKWSNLKYLSLARNKFSGTLPSWLFKFDKIQMIDYSSNRFSWFIPDDNLNSTRFKDFQTVGSLEPPGKVEIKISATVVAKDELSFSYNLLSMVGIDLSDNLLHGEIPEALFRQKNIEYLNLSYNFLEGQLPHLEKLPRLKALDLSHNSLSGQVTRNISTPVGLTLLNLSHNCFSGIITEKEGFQGLWLGIQNCVFNLREASVTRQVLVHQRRKYINTNWWKDRYRFGYSA